MVKWVDSNIGGKNPWMEESRISYGYFSLRVHRDGDYPCDRWVASSPFIFYNKLLESRDLSEAKTQATAMIQDILEDSIKDICNRQR